MWAELKLILNRCNKHKCSETDLVELWNLVVRLRTDLQEVAQVTTVLEAMSLLINKGYKGYFERTLMMILEWSCYESDKNASKKQVKACLKLLKLTLAKLKVLRLSDELMPISAMNNLCISPEKDEVTNVYSPNSKKDGAAPILKKNLLTRGKPLERVLDRFSNEEIYALSHRIDNELKMKPFAGFMVPEKWLDAWKEYIEDCGVDWDEYVEYSHPIQSL